MDSEHHWEPSIAALFANRFITKGFVSRGEPVTQESFNVAFESDIRDIIYDVLWERR
jgi:hypothetical protein